MTNIEKDLREALSLLDCVPVTGRKERLCMVRAEEKIAAVADFFAQLEKKKGMKEHADADNEQKNDA